MNVAKTVSMEAAINKGHDVYVVYAEDTKEIVNWFVFGLLMCWLPHSILLVLP